MNFLQRGLTSVFRRKGKSIILFAVIFILGNVIAGAIAISQSTANVEKKMKADLGAIATIEADFEKYMQDNPDNMSFTIENPKEDLVKKIAELSYVKEFEYSISSYAFSNQVKTVSLSNSEMMSAADPITLKGTNLELPMDFKSSGLKLVDGRGFTPEELSSDNLKVIVSNKFAEENGLVVGDNFTLDAHWMDFKEDGTMAKEKLTDYQVEVIGIFEQEKLEKKAGEQQDMQSAMFDNTQLNTLYCSNEAAKANNLAMNKAYSNEGSDEEGGTPTYVLNSPEDVEAFKEEVTPLLPEYTKINASTDRFDEVGGSVKKLSQIANYVVLIAILATLIIISLVVVLFLRDRKHELGIYLSLGEKCQNVVLQIILELLIISLIAMCFSLVTGNFLGKMVSESLIQSDALAATSNAASSGGMIIATGGTNMPSLSVEDVQNAYEVKFSLSYILTFLVAGLATVFGSALMPLMYILRLNPKKIML
ncbi:putative ABC transport system permease protein [Enterococcus sp. PF1-24]|uniref:ABC transporter permease n=1 Tax=unclassified Enterococcus TaxID=2608891 RepID=UPI00247629A1|nr:MULTISPECIES: ABC transporter permease [unclassified Enterococcus]MDH6363146.1 putative ABC transport system permease protein [Enterococcus sp. PFB1-1]MDH6400240.1 putative ABC transport system permease protein [Enterococcus sp. PF1-24]